MDTRDGTILENLASIPEVDIPFCIEMKIPPTPLQLRNRRVGRNDPCPCGGGLKFKKCCMRLIHSGQADFRINYEQAPQQETE